MIMMMVMVMETGFDVDDDGFCGSAGGVFDDMIARAFCPLVR